MFPQLSIPKRYIFAIMGLHATMFAYMMRISLDLTISRMINQTITDAEPQPFDPDACPVIMPNPNNTVIPEDVVIPGAFDWDASSKKSASSAFRTAYIMTQFLGGMVAERSGGKTIMGIAMTGLSIATFTIPFASKLMGFPALYVLRFISGFASGTMIPVLLSMMSKWAPKDEQAFIGSIIFPGALIGYVSGSYMGEQLLVNIGWESVFYIFGVMGVIWCVLWKIFIYSTPNEHPTISESEKRFLNENLPSLQRTTKYDLDPLPWKGFLRCGALWGTVVGYVGREWAFATLTTHVPQFMKDVLRLDITSSFYFVYMPYVSMWLAALLFGFICDVVIRRRFCSVKTARQIFTSIAAIGAAFSIIMIMYSGCSPVFILFWMFIGMIALGAYYSGCMISALDITPNYAGSMIGVIDNISINSVHLLPIVKDFIVTDALLKQWRLSFWIVTVLLVVSIAIYLYYVKGDQLWWDDVRKNGYPVDWTHGLIPCEGLIDENGESIYKAKKDDKEENKLSPS